MTAVGLLAAAVPAQAATPTYTAHETTTENGHTLVQTAVGHSVASGTGGRTVSITCSAAALPDGVGTGIAECYLLGADGRKWTGGTRGQALPGAVNATSAVVSVPPGTYRLCMRANAFFSRDSYALSGPTICSAPA